MPIAPSSNSEDAIVTGLTETNVMDLDIAVIT